MASQLQRGTWASPTSAAALLRPQAPPAAQSPRLHAQRPAPCRSVPPGWPTSHARPQRQRARVAAAAAADEPSIEPGPDRLPLYSQRSSKPLAEFGFSRGFEKKYELGEKIGKGAMATVHAATARATGARVAVKVMPKQRGADGFLERRFARRVRNEVDIAAALSGSLNVCYFHGAYESEAAVQLVMEELRGGQLWDRVLRGEYGERQAARLVADVLRTVAQCHARHVMMRDIKPHNFMFAGPGEAAPLKAVDFGVSVFCRPGQYITQRAGTRSVMAPEVVRERYSLPADLWSAGVVAYLLLTGRLPYPFWQRLYVRREAVTPADMFRDILHAPLDFESPPWDTLSADAKEFVQSLLQRDEALRPTAEQALQHRWLRGGGASRDVPLNASIVQRLQRFGTYGRLKRVALRSVATHIPQDSIVLQDLRGLFLELDPTDSGRVPYTRLQAELEEGTFNLSAAETQQLLAQMDVTPAGDITFPEFVASLLDWSKLQETGEWDTLVERAFQAMDADGCGTISHADLELLLCGEEGCEAPDDLEAPLRELALAGGAAAAVGGIDLAEFKRLVGAQLQDPLDLFESRLAQPPAADGAPPGHGDAAAAAAAGDTPATAVAAVRTAPAGQQQGGTSGAA